MAKPKEVNFLQKASFHLTHNMVWKLLLFAWPFPWSTPFSVSLLQPNYSI